MNLDEALDYLSKYKYKCYGHPMFMLHTRTNDDDDTILWDCTFRNPADFVNPDIREKTPLEACLKMIDFIANVLNKREDERKRFC
jgi:hypothetical protein